MINQHKEFEDIYDVLAIRIIVDTIDNCYRVLGLIHAKYTPVPKRFKDYIAVPKPNMYQSLHTTVISSDGLTFEVQIRTKEMDDVAELGIAAHWAYKENVTYSKEKEQFEIASKLKWYAELLKFNEEGKLQFHFKDDSNDFLPCERKYNIVLEELTPLEKSHLWFHSDLKTELKHLLQSGWKDCETIEDVLNRSPELGEVLLIPNEQTKFSNIYIESLGLMCGVKIDHD